MSVKIPVAVLCFADNCVEQANEYTVDSFTQKVTWATCPKHKRWVRPYVEMGGRKRTANESTLWAIIVARLGFRAGLAGKKIPTQTLEEMADDVLDGIVLSAPAARAVLVNLIREVETQEGS